MKYWMPALVAGALVTWAGLGWLGVAGVLAEGMEGEEERAPLIPGQGGYTAVLVVVTGVEENLEIAFGEAELAELARVNAAVVLPGRGDEERAEGGGRVWYVAVEAERLAEGYGIALGDGDGAVVAIVDGENRVRRLTRVEAITAQGLAGMARQWDLGRMVYDTHCARCHGLDGTEDSYPFIVTLDGIGKHMSLEEILEATWASGFVYPGQFTEEEKVAMGVYVAGL